MKLGWVTTKDRLSLWQFRVRTKDRLSLWQFRDRWVFEVRLGYD